MARRGERVFEGLRGDADFLENEALGVVVADLVVQERGTGTFGESRRSADDDHGRFFGVGPGDAVDCVEPADAIRDAQDAEAVDARVRVRGEPCAEFGAGADDVHVAFDEFVVEAEDIVARYAEDVLDAQVLEPRDQVIANGALLRHQFVLPEVVSDPV